MEFSDDELYACGEFGGAVAGRVGYDPKAKLISWTMPEGRVRAFVVKKVLEDSAELFAFVDDHGRRFDLFPLTPDYYNKNIRRKDRPSYRTKAALMAAFLESLSYG